LSQQTATKTKKDMNNGTTNKTFLNSLDVRTKNDVLSNIAKHYGISNDEAFDEVTDPEAESIMDYVTGSNRAAISLFYNKFTKTNA
jgi:predicted DsbA family dithiol-disulfide isomerase